MTKEELLSEMYRLVNRFDRDILQLMNMLRENGELNDEINVSLSDKFDIGGMQQTSFEPEIGGDTGKVTCIKEFGCFVEYAPGKEGLVHISKVSQERVENIADVLKVGDLVRVKYMGLDKKGRMDFSIKDAD